MHERTANYPGATVILKEALIEHEGYLLHIHDFPGIYSLSAYAKEDIYVRKKLLELQPDIIVNIVDGTNLERNLFLSSELMDMNIPFIVAVNMYDELMQNQDIFDHVTLSKMLNIPFVATIGNKSSGIKELKNVIINTYKNKGKENKKIHINYGEEFELAIKNINDFLHTQQDYQRDLCHQERFYIIKMLEGDKAFIQRTGIKNLSKLECLLQEERKKIIRANNGEDIETLIAESKYGFIAGALRETYKKGRQERFETTRLLDSILSNNFLSISLFFAIMFTTFYATFSLGAYPAAWIERGIESLSSLADRLLVDGIFKDALIDGVISGVGGVIVFLPNIILLFFFISFMEDTGYMARTVFMMDKLMHVIGLHGKSFIPLLIGFGCNVPAIMATRMIESKRNRMITMLIIPFMSCSARLPVYVLIVSAFFPKHQTLILFTIYSIGILIALISSLLFNRFLFRQTDEPFVMELPPYRMPTLMTLIKHIWFRASEYLKKMGTVILFASVLIWALGYFPRVNPSEEKYNSLINKIESEYNQYISLVPENTGTMLITKDSIINNLLMQKQEEYLENSYIGRIGKFIHPIFHPLGFDWKMSVSILSGLGAKEIIVSTMGVLYQAENKYANATVNLASKLKKEQYDYGTKKGQQVFNPVTALAFLVFILLYFPCVASIIAIQKESGSFMWAFFAIVYTSVIAWVMAFLVYTIGNMVL